MTQSATVVMTVVVLLAATPAPALAGSFDSSPTLDTAVGVEERVPGRATTAEAGSQTQLTNTSTEADNRSESNTTDGTRLSPEAKIAAGLLGGERSSGGGADGITTRGVTTASSAETVDVIVTAAPRQTGAVAGRVRNNSGTVMLQHGRFVQAQVPRQSLTAIADSPAVERIRRPNTPVPRRITRGGNVSEGLSKMNVSPAYAAGQYGDNVTVAVVDVDRGFNASNPAIADSVVDTYDPAGPFDTRDDGHGTAVSELVVDTAPNVSLVLIEIDTGIELATAMDYIRENTSAEVAVMSLSWYNAGPMDGSGRFNRQFERSAANGTLWSVSAGNDGDGGHWHGRWRDSDGDDWLDVSENKELIEVSEGTRRVFLQWDDWPQSDQNLDLYLFDSRSDFPTNPINGTNNVQDGKWAPVERVSTTGSTDYVAIRRESGTKPLNLTVFGPGGSLSPNTTARSVTNPTTDAVLTVGATYYGDNSVEPFSARGPSIDGRIKPDVVAPDGVSTSVYDPFFGTSAAAPHAGGVFALALDKNESLRPPVAISRLESTANDTVGDTDPNNATGHGLVDAGAVVAATAYSETEPPRLSAATAVDLTDGDGTVSTGDSVRVTVTATDTDSGIATVTANASAFGGGYVALEDTDGDDQYTGTFTVNASTAMPVPDTSSIPITATDVAGNDNRTVAAGTLALQRGAITVSLAPSRQQVTATETASVDVVVTNVTDGIGAWELQINQTGGATTITNLTLAGAPDQQTVSIAEDGNSVYATAADITGNETGNVTIATVTVGGSTIGQSTLDLTVTNLTTAAGISYTIANTTTARLTTTAPVVRSEYAGPPTDIDDDGHLEDVNGDGNFTVADVQAFYVNRETAAIQTYPASYNYNNISDVDIVDVQRLYYELQQQQQDE